MIAAMTPVKEEGLCCWHLWNDVVHTLIEGSGWRQQQNVGHTITAPHNCCSSCCHCLQINQPHTSWPPLLLLLLDRLDSRPFLSVYVSSSEEVIYTGWFAIFDLLLNAKKTK
uniref:Uncharacterized protein n=1 Tax=Ditylenchus dipsaci TaxID=166011 RepID=A0A915DIE6_9BILA